jgi:hypothetical protein
MELISDRVPDDIKQKILLLLLGIDNNWTHKICQEFRKKKRNNLMIYGNQYEIHRPQENRVQYMIICEIRIAQFDADFNAYRRKSYASGGMRNIRKYMSLLDASFKQRYKNLF